ncbi:hypothetical protein PAUR_a1943 [Pseudoalteromonas aurantia 208]|uniref:Uncharacterized protein n=1 Tax=Pseudoalteromonas aurantia 208 TaxID=1314867 RepID=A0ABR9EDM5_9GAMM|nr:hypothetical protein [Pseudoalteromonas aurantia 208]
MKATPRVRKIALLGKFAYSELRLSYYYELKRVKKWGMG